MINIIKCCIFINMCIIIWYELIVIEVIIVKIWYDIYKGLFYIRMLFGNILVYGIMIVDFMWFEDCFLSVILKINGFVCNGVCDNYCE